jgi:hypothetical protein
VNTAPTLASVAVQPAGAGAARPLPVAGRGLSDRTLAWLFVGPTIVLLLAVLDDLAVLHQLPGQPP